MAHPCFSCGSECYCSGDIDDIIVSHTPTSCIQCDWCNEEDEEDYLYEQDDQCFCHACVHGYDCQDGVSMYSYRKDFGTIHLS